MKNKVYCDNCKYCIFFHGEFVSYYRCEADIKNREELRIVDTFLEKGKKFKRIWEAKEINKNNDCKYFEECDKYSDIKFGIMMIGIFVIFGLSVYFIF